MTIGDVVRGIRITKKLSLVEVSRRCELSDKYIWKIENNRVCPSYDTMLELAKGLDVKLSKIVKEHEKQIELLKG